MLVLDTDHASELGMRSAAGIRRLQRLEAAREDAVVSATTVRGLRAEFDSRKRAFPSLLPFDYLAV